MPSAVACASSPLTVFAIVDSDLSGKIKRELLDDRARLVGVAEEAEHRERDERQRHEREQRVVGDHRRQVRPSVRLELRRRSAGDLRTGPC